MIPRVSNDLFTTVASYDMTNITMKHVLAMLPADAQPFNGRRSKDVRTNGS
jgi:hypothetical protein